MSKNDRCVGQLSPNLASLELAEHLTKGLRVDLRFFHVFAITQRPGPLWPLAPQLVEDEMAVP